MQGEFRGDFTRDTFYAFKHFSRVLMQQGRVHLDADWNEQTSILLRYLQALAADLIGPHGGPMDPDGTFSSFRISSDPAHQRFHNWRRTLLCAWNSLRTGLHSRAHPPYRRNRSRDRSLARRWI